jgi:2-(3-amino-3-carboxypropyl)histidine synthase
MLKFDLSSAIKELKKKKTKKVFVQIPEGLKTKTSEIISILEKNKIEAIAGMDPCFGACDVKPDEAKRLGCDAILHLGHTEFTQTKGLPIIYAPLNYELEDFESTIENIFHTCPY